jgi:signal transduction histidine kinase
MACERDQRVGEYMAGLPDWQQAIGRQLRDLIHAVDPEIAETIQTHGAMSGPTHAHRCARFTGKRVSPDAPFFVDLSSRRARHCSRRASSPPRRRRKPQVIGPFLRILRLGELYGTAKHHYSAPTRRGGCGMHDAVVAFRYINLVAYATLGGVALLTWHRRRDSASMWAAATFGSLGLLVIVGLIPNHPGNIPERAVNRIAIALLVLFPYLLFRFTAAFRTPGRRFANALFSLTAILILWTFALPRIPQSGEPRPGFFIAFIVVFMIHWSVLSIVSAHRLWRAGTAQPTVSRRRMQLLAVASAGLVIALVLAVFTNDRNSVVSLASGVLAFLSVTAFLLGFAPPTLVRLWWRGPEQARVQQAISSLLTFAESQEEVASRVLEPAAAIVGARAIAIRNAEGKVVAAWNVPGDAWSSLERGNGEVPTIWHDAKVFDLEVPGGSLVVWTSPYAPFFGDEELSLLRTVGALTGLALDRVRLFQTEHESRLALERANEVKSNFVALAAHELRTPMTTIHGFVTTLHHLSDRLDDEQREQVRHALLQQTHRMSALIEQLLDLSRLDADAIDIEPQPLNVRSQVEEIVSIVAPDPGSVTVDISHDTIAVADRAALERIVTNLVTNAFRYGAPPVTVWAEQSDRHFRLSVEDRGGGVSAEFIPDLFERFSRSEGSRAGSVGTGLGLAIARSYARAHGGDLLYEDADPHGAKFLLVLPAQPRVGESNH